MTGMQNIANAVSVTFTGSVDVESVDLCFKLSNSSVINVVEKFKKIEKGWSDNSDVSVEFSNQKYAQPYQKASYLGYMITCLKNKDSNNYR